MTSKNTASPTVREMLMGTARAGEPVQTPHQAAVDELAAVVSATQAALTKVFGTAPSPYIAVQAATAILDRAKNSS